MNLPSLSPVRAGALLVLALCILPTRALAGPVEQLVEVSVARGAPSLVAVRYENGGDGYLFSRDAGRTFALTCSSMLGADQVARKNPVHVLADGTSLVRSFDGLLQDDGHGCGFKHVADFEGAWVSSIAEHPDDKTITYVATSGTEGERKHGIYQRKPDGTFTLLGEHEPKLVIFKLIAARLPEGGLRFYESIARVPEDPAAGELPAFVRSSDDGGLTWREFALSGNPAPVLAAVSVTNPEHLLFVSQREGEPSQLFVSLNGGESLAPYLTLTHFAGVTQAPDGRIWIADAGVTTDAKQSRGVWFTPSLSEAAEKINDEPTTCIAHREAEGDLFVCRRAELGALSVAGDTYAQLITLRQVTGFLNCPGVDEAPTCEAQLCDAYCGPTHYADAPVCKAYDTASCGPRADDPVFGGGDAGVEADAGGPGHDGDDGQPAKRPKKSDSCAAAPFGSASHSWLCLLLLAAGLCVRRARLWPGLGLLLVACGDAPVDELADAGLAMDEDPAHEVVRCGADVPSFALDMRADGEDGHVSALLRAATPAPPEKYKNDWLVELVDSAGKPVDDAVITRARPFMPAHGHDGTFAPTVRAGKAPGQFYLDDLNLWMRGPWEVQLDVSSKRAGDDYLVFRVCIEE